MCEQEGVTPKNSKCQPIALQRKGQNYDTETEVTTMLITWRCAAVRLRRVSQRGRFVVAKYTN